MISMKLKNCISLGQKGLNEIFKSSSKVLLVRIFSWSKIVNSWLFLVFKVESKSKYWHTPYFKAYEEAAWKREVILCN